MSQNIIDINKQIQCISLFWEILAQIAKKFKKRYIQEYNSDFGDFHQMYGKFERENQGIDYYYEYYNSTKQSKVVIEWTNLEKHFSRIFLCYCTQDEIFVVIDDVRILLGTLSSKINSESGIVLTELTKYLNMFKEMKVDLSTNSKIGVK